MTRISGDGSIENKIHELRAARSLTQQSLADEVGVTRATIIALERGAYNPSLELAFRLARYFKIGIEDLFQFKTQKKKG